MSLTAQGERKGLEKFSKGCDVFAGDEKGFSMGAAFKLGE